jgi:hypothetical protein
MNATATAPARQRKPRQKQPRFIRWVVRPGDITRTGVARITEGKAADDYLVTAMPADFGRAFEVVKLCPEEGNPTYHVLLAADGKHSCECKGFLRWGRCKHADGLAALKRAGRL